MRLVASDLDGTIVRHDGTMSPRTVAALARCAERGVDVVFVTGRPMRWMPPVAEATGHTGVAILGNGALVYDLGTEEILDVRALTPDAVIAATAALREVLPHAAFGLETLSGYRREPGFMPHHTEAHRAMTGTIAELVADDPVVLKVLCRDETSTADPMLALARPALAGIAEPVHSDARSSLVEVAALGVSKASTLAMLVEQRGIAPSDVVAFGDMPNDVAMLHWAGRGFAVADGHPEVLAAADEIAPPCAQDGVAQVLERLLAEMDGETDGATEGLAGRGLESGSR